jgi:hypothetical protein
MEVESSIPKIIYTFWHDINLPPLVQRCIDSWKHHNPDHKFVIVNLKTIGKYVDKATAAKFRKVKSYQHLSDLFRLYILSERGGIWLDASIFMTINLDWVHNSEKQFVGYFLKGTTTLKDYPVIESWFLAARPGSPFLKKWKIEFFKMFNFSSIASYVNHYKTLNFQQIPDVQYRACYIAVQAVLQLGKYPLELLDLHKSDTGPMNCYASNWSIDRSLRYLIEHKRYYRKWRMIKITGPMRDIIIEKALDLNSLFPLTSKKQTKVS